ncbi:uncharacterized protein TRIADDRAFT_61236 [Trichoplax adhaerens]|uniref:Uncharacterized protein n=1 Tax=Trichoplax adhaerens TaxID=10228 RepID=B3SAF0_TRIAD|nr:hypothetical protein TRIADDRAFT_61236 [Trichoplax adhaerens]EDV20246.1 hypothetical protein TRIADDRAFT_61236 [Trichoplax adhaerens]|eukprot:XP_002117196.1 hypothetical protein TRIADDRAFT_61236 [Trichoplax adhaerens]
MAANALDINDSYGVDYQGFVALHLGAGKHQTSLRPIYKRISQEACSKALSTLSAEKSVTKAVTEAMVSLETCGVVNAGVGSALNSDGAVQCDASIMDGQSLAFGAVGCVSGIPNPTQVAFEILRNSNNRHRLGLISPLLLTGDGARDFAIKNGIHNAPPESLISDKALKKYFKIKEMVASLKSATTVNESIGCSDDIQDTIGVICVDSSGQIAVAASSGGNQFKMPGRIGQSAIYGAGCCAYNGHESHGCSVAATTTGVGEQIIRTNLAKQLCDEILNQGTGVSMLRKKASWSVIAYILS